MIKTPQLTDLTFINMSHGTVQAISLFDGRWLSTPTQSSKTCRPIVFKLKFKKKCSGCNPTCQI